MVLILVAPLLIGLLVAFLIPIFRSESEIDSCLDSGGSFNYKECKCDFKLNHTKPEKNECK